VGTKRRILLVGLFLALIGGLGCLLWLHPGEPKYQGKPLSFWLDQEYLGTNGYGDTIKAEEAVRTAGSNAIPTLLRMISANDSPLKLKLLALAQKQHFFAVRHVPAEQQHRAGVMGIYKLEAAAISAEPGLIRIYERNISPDSQSSAIHALSFLGPAAKGAVPTLLRALKNPVPEVRRDAAATLGAIHSEPALVVPALIKALDDTNWDVRDTTCAWLSVFAPESKLAVPRLVKMLDDGDSMARDAAADALWRIDPQTAAQTVVPMRIKWLSDSFSAARAHNAYELGYLKARAKTAVPKLIELLKDEDADVRTAAATALKQIDPETAAPILRVLPKMPPANN
jgi:HEAT repeat protein